MATRFEMFLVGDDEEHLQAVGEAALDEVSRVERLLSRHDPASEVSRINREAASRPVRVDRELFAILDDCQHWHEATDGYFDPCATGEADSSDFGRAILLDPGTRTIRFLEPKARLDFGGYGKGYALDAAARVLDEFGVESALLHGGTSSILARGRQADGSPWRVGLRDPFETRSGSEREQTACEENTELLVPTVLRGNAVFDAPRRPEGRGASGTAFPRGAWERVGCRELAQLELTDRGMSSSAVFDRDSTRSDLVDPIRSRPLDRQAACAVIAPMALEAEVLSTAYLAMGKERASSFFSRTNQGLRAAWIDRVGDEVTIEWLGVGMMP